MRIFSSLLVASILLAATPAMAGRVAYADGQGRWVPSACEAPRAPTAPAAGATATDLNTNVAAHNAYVEAAAAYMDCVSKEAQRDADAMSRMIIESAQDIMNKTQAEAGQPAAHK